MHLISLAANHPELLWKHTKTWELKESVSLCCTSLLIVMLAQLHPGSTHLSGRCQKSQPERKQEAHFLRLTDYWRCSLMYFLFVITFIEGFNNDDVRMSVCSGKMCEERKQRNSHATGLWKNDIFSLFSLLHHSSFTGLIFIFSACLKLLFVKLLPVKLS